MTAPTIDRYIESTPDVAGGRPRITGHRITVMDVAIWHERMGRTVDEICADYDLALAEVYAALAYYHDHRTEVDDALRASEEFAQALRQQIPTKVAARIRA